MEQQYSLKSGLRRFGGNGGHPVTSDLAQLHEMETFTPLDANKLTNKNNAEAIYSLVFIAETCMV